MGEGVPDSIDVSVALGILVGLGVTLPVGLGLGVPVEEGEGLLLELIHSLSNFPSR